MQKSIRITLKFEDQNYYNNNINPNITDENLFEFLKIIEQYMKSKPLKIYKLVKTEL
jgi:hypothetical protein